MTDDLSVAATQPSEEPVAFDLKGGVAGSKTGASYRAERLCLRTRLWGISATSATESPRSVADERARVCRIGPIDRAQSVGYTTANRSDSAHHPDL